MCAAAGDEGMRPGMVAVVQTAGDLANWHPHVHAIVSRGGWTRDWRVGAGRVRRRACRGAAVPPQGDAPAAGRGVAHSDERTELLLSWRHTGFSVHNRVRVEPEDQPAVERLARYIMRPPISLERMQWGGEGVVHYRAKGGHDGRTLPAGDAAEAFDPAEFVARVIMHIPEPRRHLVRYYGGTRTCRAASGGRRRSTLAPRPRMAGTPLLLRPTGTAALTPGPSAGAGRSSSSGSTPHISPAFCCGRRCAPPSGVFSPRGARRTASTRSAPLGSKTPLGTAPRRPRYETR